MSDRILVVDDEVDLATTCERLLRRQGYQVVSVGSRGEALRVVTIERPSLVIVDLRLPDGNGLDVVRAARTAESPAPVIVVSAWSSAASRRAALDAGAAAFLAKPFTTAEFSRLVTRVLGEA